MKDKTNKTAILIYVLGLSITIIGIIASLICAAVFGIKDYYSNHYNWAIALLGSFGSILSGAFYFGLSEIIELLDTNKAHLWAIRKELNDKKQEKDVSALE